MHNGPKIYIQPAAENPSLVEIISWTLTNFAEYYLWVIFRDPCACSPWKRKIKHKRKE